jgi:hypothetical protein
MAEARSNFTKAASAPARLGSMTENCRTGAPWSMSVSASMMGKMRRAPWVSAFKTVFNAQSTGGSGEEHEGAASSWAGTFVPKGPRRGGLVLHTFYSGFLTTDFADELIEEEEGVKK